MTLLDERGRLFGKINVIDAAFAVLVLLLVPLGYGAYVLFRMPAPTMLSVEPSRVPGEDGTRIQLSGRNLRPFLNVYAGTSRATLLVETPTKGEVRLPALAAGTYDLVLYDAAREVARLHGALSVEALRSRATLYGAFAGLDREQANRLSRELHAGQTLASGFRVLSVAALQPEYVTTQTLSLPVAGRFRVPAELEVDCVIMSLGTGACQAAGVNVTDTKSISVPLGTRTLSFQLTAVEPQGSEVVEVEVLAAPPFRLDAVAKPGDTEYPTAAAGPPRQATLVGFRAPLDPRRVGREWAFRIGAVENGPTAELRGEAPSVIAVIRLPAERSAGGWMYRRKPLRIGESFIFETPRYVLRGVIVDMRVVSAGTP